MNTSHSFMAERLSELVFEREKTVPEIIKELDIPANTFYRYLRGAQPPNLKMAIKLADYFSCSIDFLLGRTDTNEPPKHPPIPFSERIPQLLQVFGVNKAQLYKAAEIHPSVFFRWQKGETSPELASICLLADAFGCSVEFILGREN